MSKVTTFTWRGFYGDSSPQTRKIPQFGELWRLPETLENIGGYCSGEIVWLTPDIILMGTGKYKFSKWNDFGDQRLRIKMMMMDGRFIWMFGEDVGLLEQIAECPQ